MALPGISNANEFYSAHYLESMLAGDIKKVRERWSEEAKAQLWGITTSRSRSESGRASPRAREPHSSTRPGLG